MKRAMPAVMTLMLLTGVAFAQQVDSDGDTIPDAIEAQIATDPDFAEPLELLYEDPVGEADTSRGAECVPFGDFGRIWFAPVAKGRYLWKIDLGAETDWPPAQHDVRILYVDADNDPSTGRPDMGPGCDIMFYLSPNRENRLIDWNYPVASVTASDGRSIYLVADVDLNQQDGQSVFHARMLYQDTRDDHRANADHMPWTEFTAAGESDRAPIEVAEDHALYVPPQAVRHVGARVLFDGERPRAEITFTTDVPTRPVVQFGPTENYGAIARGEENWNNHRISLDDLQPDRDYHYRVRVRARDGEIVTEDATFSTALPETPTCSVERATVMLTVDNPHSARADNAPITTGLPFPEGVLGDEAHLRLLDADGREVPLQTEVTARYPDGSVQWLLLDFVADIAPESTASYAVEFGSEVERTAEAGGISVTETDGALVVDTGELRVIFDPAHSDLIAAAHVDVDNDGRYSREEAVLNERIAGPSSLTMRDGEGLRGYLASLDDPRVEVEREGPLSTIVKVSGTHTDTAGNDLFRFISRYHFTAGSGLVRVKHTVENDQTQQALTRIEDYGMGLPVSLGQDATVTVEAAGGETLQTAATEKVTLVQDLDNHWSLLAPATHQEGERGPASIDVSAADRGLWVGLRHFREKWPSSLAWEPEIGAISVYLLPPFETDRYADLGDPVESDRLYYHLRDGGYRLHWGVSFTREMWLGFHEGDGWPEAWAQQLREPLVAVAEPEWYCASGAFGPRVPREDGRFEQYEQMVERTFEGLMDRREANRSYGFLNFGDWWGERGYNWGNMEYDTPHGQMVQFIRTGDRKFFDEACLSAVHNRDVDYAHHEPGGRDHYRTRSHRMFHTGGYEPRMADEQMGLAYYTDGGLTNVLSGHQWNRGGFDHYFMTGERRSWDVALGLAEYMAGPGTVNFTMGRGAERAVAWALYDALSAYRVTWDPFYLNGARLMVEDVIDRQTEAGHWSIPAGYSDVDPLPIGGYAWCSGLLITWLHEYNQYAQDPRVDEVILNAAEWLVREEYMPHAKGFRSCSCDTFNDRTRPGHSAWSVADAMAIAYELSGDTSYLDLAQMTFGYYAQSAGTMGKNYSQSIITSSHLIARLHAAGRDDIDTARWEEPLEALVPRVVPPKRDMLVLLRARGDEPVTADVAIGDLRKTVTLKPEDGWREVALKGPAGPVTGTITCGDQVVEVAAERLGEAPAAVGEGAALVAGDEDWLGPALEAMGVQFERIADLSDLGRFGTIYLGTQACSLDAAGVRQDPAPLLQWLYAGGTVVVSQPNDSGWDPMLFGAPLIMQEPDGTMGEIAAPGHALFAGLDAGALAGAKMYDSVAMAGAEWDVPATDAEGRPAVLELSAGKGRVIVMVPSFERYVTGELAGSDELVAACRRLMESVTGRSD